MAAAMLKEAADAGDPSAVLLPLLLLLPTLLLLGVLLLLLLLPHLNHVAP
jgi:hypothetical protein